MSGGVTEALRGWIRAYDLWLNEGEGEAPTVDSLCEVADAIDLAAQGEVCERIVRCRDCRFAHETCDGMFDCNGPLVETWDDYNDAPKDNPVEPNGFCAWGERRAE